MSFSGFTTALLLAASICGATSNYEHTEFFPMNEKRQEMKKTVDSKNYYEALLLFPVVIPYFGGATKPTTEPPKKSVKQPRQKKPAWERNRCWFNPVTC